MHQKWNFGVALLHCISARSDDGTNRQRAGTRKEPGIWNFKEWKLTILWVGCSGVKGDNGSWQGSSHHGWWGQL